MKPRLMICALSLLFPQAAGKALAHCDGHLEGSTQIVLADYDPFAAIDSISPRTLGVRNTGYQGCRFRVVFARTQSNGRFGEDIEYSVTGASGTSLLQSDHSPFDLSKSLETPTIAPNSSASVAYSLFVGRGQLSSPGYFGDSVWAILLSEGGSTEFDRQYIRLSLPVRAIANVSIAGGGLATSVNFGSLEPGKTRTVMLQTQSNEQYTIRLASGHRSRLRLDPPIAGQDWSVEYRVEIDGVDVDLGGETAMVQANSPASGERTHALSFRILEASNKRAGLYKDVVTATICPNH